MGISIELEVNGASVSEEVEPRLLLAHLLREELGLTGTKIGCDTSQCGSCTILLDGQAVKSCTVLAVQADGSEITTIEAWQRGISSYAAASGTTMGCSAASARRA